VATFDPPCSVCGGLPAASATFRAVTVILIGIGVQTRAGWFCREKVSRLPAPRFPPVPPEDAGPGYGRPLPPARPVRQSPVAIVPIVLIGLLLCLCQGPRLFS
jgi:hypothetical protein